MLEELFATIASLHEKKEEIGGTTKRKISSNILSMQTAPSPLKLHQCLCASLTQDTLHVVELVRADWNTPLLEVWALLAFAEVAFQQSLCACR